MNWLMNLGAGLKSLFQKRRVERELDEELDSFLDASMAQKQSGGMTPDAARRAAVRVEEAAPYRPVLRDLDHHEPALAVSLRGEPGPCEEPVERLLGLKPAGHGR